jgi:diguanylate cyclase (GGDEF)-like protein
MLRLYMLIVLVTAILAITSVLLTSSRVDRRSQQASKQANAAVTAAHIQADLRDPISLLLLDAFDFVNSDALNGIRPEIRMQLLEEVLRNPDAVSPILTPLPAMEVPISERDAFALQRDLETVSIRIDELTATDWAVDLSAVLAQQARMEESLVEYLDTKTATSFRELFSSMVTLGARLNEASDAFAFSLLQTQASVASATQLARYTMIASLSALTVTMGIATIFIGRMIQRAFASSERERAELFETTKTLQYRNDQLNALYNVFAEITDTLNMRYVISATLKQTIGVMRASMVTLRLLRGNQLVMAGNLTAAGKEIADLPPVPLGEGPTGRVARRGRSMRIDERAQDLLGPSPDPNDPDSGVESGIIVPLIVGARVVGTLACWSPEPHAFGEEDERILEMMASQVATAVLAADTTETFERRALQDPLTSLPNRRQLAQDIAGHLSKWHGDGHEAAVAMVDIDHFKHLNDDFGHRVGDVTLQKVAAVMRHSIRDSDRIYRYGGEEFVVIFAGCDREHGIRLAERLLKAVAETPLSGDQLEPVGPVTVTAGLALMPEHGADFQALIELADKAMYRAKQAGRNRVLVWDERMTQPGTTIAA